MAMAGDGRAPYENGGGREKLRKRPFPSEICEEPQNVSQEAGQNNSTGASDVCTHQVGSLASISVTVGKSELEQILKQMTFTRPEAQSLISLVHSRIMEESPSPLLASSALKRHKHGDKTDNFHASVSSSRVRLPKTPMASPTTIENLPHELLSNIFIRLLSKQLAQMRSVSKSWNTLLCQSSFIKSHLHRPIHNNNDQILLFFHGHSDSKPFTAHSCRSPHLELTNFIKLPLNPRPERTTCILIVGSVNGLICSSYGHSVIQIWNPSLSAILTLPPYSMPSRGHNSLRIQFRFGFDPITDDYKVVKLSGLTGPPPRHDLKCWLHLEIYSMRKGTWELITKRFPSHIVEIMYGDYLCGDGHDGHLHWLCCVGKKMDSKTIIAFDLGTETFREMPLPDSIQVHNCDNILSILAGKLCVLSQVRNNESHETCDVWAMDEYGAAESWVKRNVLSQFYGPTCKLGFTSRDEFLTEYDGSIVLYDPIANEQKVLEDFSSEEYSVAKVVEYVDSLVWVAPAGHEMVGGGRQN